MTIGFTGTRQGMTYQQRTLLFDTLRFFKSEGAHLFVHGGAVGADREAAKVAEACGYVVQEFAIEYGESPLHRNHRIVAACDLLVAAPVGDVEELRSGTWATVRYARQKPMPVVMLARGLRAPHVSPWLLEEQEK